jgi:hypothetical protein
MILSKSGVFLFGRNGDPTKRMPVMSLANPRADCSAYGGREIAKRYRRRPVDQRRHAAFVEFAAAEECHVFDDVFPAILLAGPLVRGI